ncbi:MAG: hypothetical protein COA78_30935, partial [Blastopirellula sp.]
MIDPAKAIAAFPLVHSVTANQVQQLISEDGFSGSLLWKIATNEAVYLLRCWPSETKRERIEWIHQVQHQVRESGFQFTPQLIQAQNQQTFVQADGRYWELASWMPGTSLVGFDQPESSLLSMFGLLAQFHLHSAKIPAATPTQTGCSSTVQERIDLIEYFNAIPKEQISAAIVQTQWNDFIERAMELLDAYRKQSKQLSLELNSVKHLRFNLQPCLRDARGEHFLFEAGEPSGLIDYGAMRMESVAVDLARLSSTTIRSKAKLQHDAAITHYEQLRPLSSDEKSLIPVLMDTSRYLTGMNWIRWVAMEKRVFASSNGVV